MVINAPNGSAAGKIWARDIVALLEVGRSDRGPETPRPPTLPAGAWVDGADRLTHPHVPRPRAAAARTNEAADADRQHATRMPAMRRRVNKDLREWLLGSGR